MTDKRYKKLVLIFSTIAGFAILTSIPAHIIDSDICYAISYSLMVIAFISLFSVVLTRTELTGKVEKKIWRFLLILLMLIIPGAIFEIMPLVIAPSVSLLLFLGVMVFFSDRKTIIRIMILLSFLILGFIMKKNRLPGAGMLISIALGILAAGSLIMGINILLTQKDNLYFRIVGFVCSFLISLCSLAIMFKYQHWPLAGILSYMSLIPIIVVTLFVLITLPNSGFINWKKEQKHIFTRKILIPWVFFLLFMALRLLLPMHVQKKIFEKDPTTIEPFNMFPYAIEMKDGMEEDQ